MSGMKISRNAPCSCHSGRKFKHCCLRRNQSQSTSSPPTTRSKQNPRETEQKPGLVAKAVEADTDSGWHEVLFDAPLENGGRLHAVLLYTDAGLRFSPIQTGKVVTLKLPEIELQGLATVVAIRPTEKKGTVEGTVLRVVQFRNDDDLGEALLGDWGPPAEFLEHWMGRRRVVILKLEHPDGSWCDITLLRTVAWIAETGAQVGGKVFLELAEMGARGWAEVIDIKPCKAIETGVGRLVTGTFCHSHGQIGELVVEGEPEVIGVTPGHLFWSADRKDWVPVSKLRPGETLHTHVGYTKVISYTMTKRIEPVYNLEVDIDHCYRVGKLGLLVHNASTGPLSEEDCKSVGNSKRKTIKITGKGPVREYFFEFDQCRTTKASGRIYAIDNEKNEDRKESQQIKMLNLFFGQHKLRDSYDAGHLIANELGGPGDLENLVPQRKPLNQNKAWRQMEQWLFKCAEKLIGDMTVEVGYDDKRDCPPTRDIPTTFKITVMFKYRNGVPAGTETGTISNRANASVWKKKSDPCPGDNS